jgi:hypothetical protein
MRLSGWFGPSPNPAADRGGSWGWAIDAGALAWPQPGPGGGSI